MIYDVFTLVRKEWKEMFLQRGSWKSGLLNQLVVLAVLGVFLPLQAGAHWLANPALALSWLWLPVSLTMNLVADAFAGERERHTLDTLLASRLSDQAILIGKLAAASLYGFSLAVLSMLTAAVTINVAFPAGYVQFYPLDTFPVLLAAVLLINVLMASLGGLVSLHAQTARQAFQYLSIAMLVLFVGPLLVFQFAPAGWKETMAAALAGWSTARLLSGLLVTLALLDAGFLGAARLRFQRAKLMEDI